MLSDVGVLKIKKNYQLDLIKLHFLTWLTVPANFNIVEVSSGAEVISVFRFLQFKTNADCGLSEMWRFMRITADMLKILNALDVLGGIDRLVTTVNTFRFFKMVD